MFRKTLVIAAVLTAIVMPSLASAGAKRDSFLTVSKSSSGGGYMRGAVGTVRNSSSAVEFINCFTNSGGGGMCHAINRQYVYLYCSAPRNSQAVDLMRSIQDSSYVYVKVNSAGVCTHISVNNGSQFAPK